MYSYQTLRPNATKLYDAHPNQLVEVEFVTALTCSDVAVAGAFLRESPYAVWRSGGDHHDIQMLMGQ